VALVCSLQAQGCRGSSWLETFPWNLLRLFHLWYF
jgi:hypothetical protein